MPNSRLGWLLYGILLFVMGFVTILNKGWHIVRGAPTHHTIGYIFIAGGIIFCLYALLKKEFKKTEASKSVICTVCLNLFFESDLTNGNCPKCGMSVDDAVGFFERHPELKSKKRT